MTPELSRRLGQALGMHLITPAERDQVVAAVEAGAETWEDLPGDVRRLVEEIEGRPGS